MTQNNSISMKTQVETYIIEETKELIYDNEKLDQWNGLIESLGLEGQKEIVQTDKSPIPFMWMNEALLATFEQLCPTKKDVSAYNKTPIPVEVLSLIALSQKEGYFFKMEVWYNEKDPDPCVIGYKAGRGNSAWEKDYYADKYLLARWADVKASLGELVQRAKALFIAKTSNELKEKIKREQRELEDIELTAANKFASWSDDSITSFDSQVSF